jgi:hypothetical protein
VRVGRGDVQRDETGLAEAPLLLSRAHRRGAADWQRREERAGRGGGGARGRTGSSRRRCEIKCSSCECVVVGLVMCDVCGVRGCAAGGAWGGRRQGGEGSPAAPSRARGPRAWLHPPRSDQTWSTAPLRRNDTLSRSESAEPGQASQCPRTASTSDPGATHESGIPTTTLAGTGTVARLQARLRAQAQERPWRSENRERKENSQCHRAHK